jgi:hypothetical protein
VPVPLKARQKSRPEADRTKFERSKARKTAKPKHPPFADSAKSRAPEKSKGSSEFNGWGYPPVILTHEIIRLIMSHVLSAR